MIIHLEKHNRIEVVNTIKACFAGEVLFFHTIAVPSSKQSYLVKPN